MGREVLEKDTTIAISENYRAVWDGKMNWVLEEYTTVQAKGKNKDGEERDDWRFVGYFSNVPTLLKYLLKYVLVPSAFKGQEVELTEVIRVVEDANHRFRRVLNEY